MFRQSRYHSLLKPKKQKNPLRYYWIEYQNQEWVIMGQVAHPDACHPSQQRFLEPSPYPTLQSLQQTLSNRMAVLPLIIDYVQDPWMYLIVQEFETSYQAHRWLVKRQGKPFGLMGQYMSVKALPPRFQNPHVFPECPKQ